MPELPDAEVQNPSCGACRGETRFGGDVFECEDCRLIFDPSDLSASYRDEEEPTCGATCDNKWHGDERISQGWGYACEPCPLPSEHDSLHHHPCRAVRLDQKTGEHDD